MSDQDIWQLRQDAVEWVEASRRKGDRRELARAVRGLGEIERKLGDDEAALQCYEEAVAIFREEGEVLRLAHTVRHLGDVHFESGRAELAEPCYEEALALYRGHATPPPGDLANAIRSMAVLKDDVGREDEATALWKEAARLYSSLGVKAGVAESRERLGGQQK